MTSDYENLHLLALCDMILKECNSIPIKQIDINIIEYNGLRVNIDTCLKNLQNDKFIEYDYPMINLTPNGQLFIECGGYIQKLKDTHLEKKLQASYEQMMRDSTLKIAKWTVSLTLATWIAAITAIFLFLLGIYTYFHPNK